MKSNTRVRPQIPHLALVWRRPYTVRHHARGVLWFIGIQIHEVVFEETTVVLSTGCLEQAKDMAHRLNAAFNLGRASALTELQA